MSDVINNHLKYWHKGPVSPTGERVARLLDEWAGLHHFDSRSMEKADWGHPYFVQILLAASSYTGHLATFDFNMLTALVFLAHDHCIRVDISPCNGTHYSIDFHPRHTREGRLCERHPTLEQAVADWRKSYPSSQREPAAAAGAV